VDNSSRPDYKGSGVLFLKNVFLYILAMAPLLSFCLMGEKWLRIFLIMFIPAVPLMLLVGILVSRFDSFSFDDRHQQIVKPVGRGIPYQSVMRIDINETGRLLQASIKQGTLRRALLAYALDGKDKPRLIVDMLKRFPQSAMRERQYVDWKSIFIIMAVVVLMTSIFHLYQ